MHAQIAPGMRSLFACLGRSETSPIEINFDVFQARGAAVGVATAATEPVQGAVGTTAKMPSYSLGYAHPATAVGADAVSLGLNHPLALCVTRLGAAVNVAGGIVSIGAVLVYVGRRLTGTSAETRLTGGQGNCEDDDAGMEEGVPVCQGWKVPMKGTDSASSASQVPNGVLGSCGIHPCAKPSEYDHSGASIRPACEGAICKTN